MNKYLKNFTLGLCFIVFLISPMYLHGQDLGSSSGLFRSKKTAKKKKTVKKKRNSSKKRTSRKVKKKSRAKKSRKSRSAKKSVARRKKSPKKVNITRSKPTPAKAILLDKNKVNRKTVITYGGSRGFSETFEKAIEQGNVARNRRDYVMAERAYNRAKLINSSDSRAIYGLGNIYSDQQRWEEAEKAYRKAIKIEPDNPASYVALSYVLTQPIVCLLYTSPSPRDKRQSRMPSSA